MPPFVSLMLAIAVCIVFIKAFTKKIFSPNTPRGEKPFYVLALLCSGLALGGSLAGLFLLL